MAEQPKISCILLAAGASRRMGQPKLALPFRGGTVLSTTMAAIQGADFHERILVSRDPISAPGIRNLAIGAAADIGMHRSIRAGIEALEDCDGVCIALADQPLLRAEDYNFLIRAFGQKDLIYPEKNGERGNPALVGQRYFQEILAHPDDDRGCFYLFARHPERVSAVSVEVGGYFRDLDDWESYSACVK